MAAVDIRPRAARRGHRGKYVIALSALVVLVAIPFQAAGAITRVNLWVKSTGANTGNCKVQASPCATITYALSQAPLTGTNINLLSDIADEVNVNKDNVTILSSPATGLFSIRPITNTLVAQTPEGAAVAPIVYVGQSRSAIALKNIKIDGSARPTAGACDPGKGHTGLYVRSAQVTLSNTSVLNITQGAGLEGCQNGSAIYVRTDPSASSNVSITRGTVSGYDKNGITCNSVGTTCAITSTTVTGRGAVGLGDAAQNGIQFGFGATGTIASVTVSNNNYQPTSDIATGILLYNAGDGVLVKNSNLFGNNINLDALNDGGGGTGQTTANLTVTTNKAHDAAADIGNYAEGITLDSLTNATVTSNTVYGNSEVGIAAWGIQASNINSNNVNDHSTADPNGDGIFVGGPGYAFPTSNGNNVNLNKSSRNTADGIHVDANTAGNTFSSNTMTRDGLFEAHDESTGGGSVGTANTWTTDHCSGGTSSPTGLCS
ncbi:MAG: hypothetical protein QOI55_264 [Actinomycetota bacterium]|nr:hypothetical protein [Actinomycetota bacterium]